MAILTIFLRWDRQIVANRFRYRCLTSLNITQMISDSCVKSEVCFYLSDVGLVSQSHP